VAFVSVTPHPGTRFGAPWRYNPRMLQRCICRVVLVVLVELGEQALHGPASWMPAYLVYFVFAPLQGARARDSSSRALSGVGDPRHFGPDPGSFRGHSAGCPSVCCRDASPRPP